MSETKQRLEKLSSTQRSVLAEKLHRLAAPGAGGGTRLVAYVVPETGCSVQAADLRAALAGRLPDYMLPAQIILLESLPLTPNGKLDRAALPRAGDIAMDDQGYLEPRTETEKQIARIWAELLGFEMIGVHDNFFELGGHSLLVIQAIARLRDRFHVDLGFTAFFERPTVRQLAEYIEDKLGEVLAGDRDEMEF